ncbi:adenylate kinase family protein [Halobacterium bonnevillei]|uniref:Putative adenylate kinase n=1 Tax=Halobacterium bonnevillei TaxID=2692200 RepID=A0A6B0SLK6_9EURY|nr:adenylate kinase family protein [Halobacterium bonnevillei]MXR22147.1 AAA family ATPase [Halobacterium bonnevillei]
MRVAVTGTPGTGKTTATELLDTDLDVVHLNDAIEEEELYTEVDEARDSKVADLEAVREWLDGRDNVLVESHLAHLLDADRVVVLRCAPGELERRLVERGEPAAKARENAESEALDVILSESVRVHGERNVYEIDATDRDPGGVADEIAAAIAGDRDPSAGDVDFTDYL